MLRAASNICVVRLRCVGNGRGGSRDNLVCTRTRIRICPGHNNMRRYPE
jgi:hypothetical protein